MNWSYLAGFFDGEGNIHINKNNTKSNYQILVRLYSSNEDILKKIKLFLGYGQIYIKKKTGVYELTISKKHLVKEFLSNIYPLSFIKKEQIEFIINNYNFILGKSNNYFDLDKYRILICKKNVDKSRKNHTVLKLIGTNIH
jgi:intein/homing endonuclease